MTGKYVFINNSFIPEDQASIHVSDLSIHRGYGIFDFFKTIQGKPVFLKDHLERFYNSASKMHLQIEHSPEQLESILTELLDKNDMPDSGVKLVLTGGYSPDGYMQAELPNLIISQQALTVSMEFNPIGLNLVTYDHQRQLSDLKTIDYAMAVWLQPFIKENQADDVVYHSEGLLKETPRANFFIVTADQEVITAKNKVLKGVMRKQILNFENSGFKITERDFTLEELGQAKEAFISSTTKHILPVLKINGRDVGNGKAGFVTQQLSELLLEKVRQEL